MHPSWYHGYDSSGFPRCRSIGYQVDKMWPLSHLSFCSGLLLGLSALSAATLVVHERREVTSSNWVKRARVSPSDTHVVRIGLAQSSLEEAHDLLMDV